MSSSYNTLYIVIILFMINYHRPGVSSVLYIQQKRTKAKWNKHKHNTRTQANELNKTNRHHVSLPSFMNSADVLLML